MKEGYKKTELGWIPEEWDIKQLSDISEVIMGQSPDSDTYNDDGDGIPFFQGKTEFGRISPIVRKWCTKPTKIAKPLDILISVRAPVGEVNINIDEACIGRGLAAIRERNSNYKFIFYYIQSIKEKLNSSAQGSTFTAINSGDLKQLKAIVPPLKEQQKIAEILSTVDSQIDDTDKLIEKTKELKKGLMQRLLTKGIGHRSFKMTEIGEIPVEWEIRNNFINIFSGFGFKLNEYVDDGIPLVRINNVTHGKILNEDWRYLPNSYRDIYKEYMLKKGDILLALNRPITRGKLKICVLNMESSILYQRVGKLVMDESLYYPIFFYYYIQSSIFMKKLEAGLVGSDQPYIKNSEFKEMKFAIPSIEEQKQIAKILMSVDIQIEKYENKKGKLEELKKGLMQQLLTGKIRVV